MHESLPPLSETPLPSTALLADLQAVINHGKSQVVAAVNSALTLTFWHVGKRINDEILQGERAAYGKQVIPSLAKQLVRLYGRSFEARNLRRMMQFATLFPDFGIVTPLVSQLSWTHFTILLMLPSDSARQFYAHQSIEHQWSKRELVRQIERKTFERKEIADSKFELATAPELSGAFKDPYFFDFLDLPDGYLEQDLEQALIRANAPISFRTASPTNPRPTSSAPTVHLISRNLTPHNLAQPHLRQRRNLYQPRATALGSPSNQNQRAESPPHRSLTKKPPLSPLPNPTKKSLIQSLNH